MTPWLALARFGANSFPCANRADRCQNAGFPHPVARGVGLSTPNGPIGTKRAIGTGVAQWPETGLADANEADPIDAARARGWHVELRPVGLLIDTRDQAPNLALMDRLHGVMQGQEAAWPAVVLADPAEITLRGELDTIEREWS